MQRTALPFDVFVVPAVLPIAQVRHRDRVAVGGVVTALAPTRWAGETRALDATITDSSGSFTVSFLGRCRIAGVEIGRRIVVGGALIQRHGRLTMMNPELWLVAEEEHLDDDLRVILPGAGEHPTAAYPAEDEFHGRVAMATS